MKKAKVIVLILSTFFAFGLSTSAYGQKYVDVQTAKDRVLDKFTQIGNDLQTAKSVGGTKLYYETEAKQKYYENLLIAFKHKLGVEEALNQTDVVFPRAADELSPSSYVNDKNYILSLKDEADLLLRF